MNRHAPWLTIVRLGLVQASIGAMVVFATSTLNRVMVVELALPAIVPGALVAFHYAVQMLRPRWGFGSDRQGRRKPWIVGGMAMLALGTVGAACATGLMRSAPVAGTALAVLAFALIGIGVGAAGTSLLVLLAKQVGERRRAAAATIVWMMMIAGFIVTAAVAGRMLDPFSIEHVIEASVAIAGTALVISVLAILSLDEAPSADPSLSPSPSRSALSFWPALHDVWAEPEARRFTLFVFLSMLAYSAQELIIEPFAGTVFALSPAESAKLAGLQHSGLLAGMIAVAVLGSAFGAARLRSMRLWTSGGCLGSALAILALAATGFGGNETVMRGALFGLGFANGAFSISAIGAMMQLAGAGGPGREGVRMGLWGAAQALAFATGGLVGTSASDLARQVFGSAPLAYALVFIGEAILFCWAAAFAAQALPQTSSPRPSPRRGLQSFGAPATTETGR